MRGKETASQAGQWLDCPSPPPSPFGPVDVGEVEGHSAEARDLNSDNWPNGPGPGGWCGPGCGFRRNTYPSWPASRGAPWEPRGCQMRAPGGAVLRRVLLARRRASFPPSPSPFRARWRVTPPLPGRTTQSPPCPQAPPLTEAEAEGQNPEGKQSSESKLAGTCCRREVDRARSGGGGEARAGRAAAWGRWRP